ncbi:MAG: undecaprenyl-diphosphate phosphatase [Armatimonadia bacterium]
MTHEIVSWWAALLLAFVQGATEFIPVSSSGHLVILSDLLGMDELPVAFAVVVHLGTLVAVMLYMRREIIAIFSGGEVEGAPGEKISARRLWLPLFVGTIPAVVLGFAFKDLIEFMFGAPLCVGVILLLTALVLWLADRSAKHARQEPITWQRGLFIGLGQAASALLRGLSRSGTTISVGLACGLSREMAAKFSFLLSTIAIGGAGLWEAKDIAENPLPPGQLPVYLVGGLVAAVVGYISIYFVMDTVKHGSLFKRFGYYCVVLSVFTIIGSLTGYLG